MKLTLEEVDGKVVIEHDMPLMEMAEFIEKAMKKLGMKMLKEALEAQEKGDA